MNLSGLNFGMQPFSTPCCSNLQTQLPQQTNIPCQPINQPVNFTSGSPIPMLVRAVPMSVGSMPSSGGYYVPYPQTYLPNTPNVQTTQTFGQQQTNIPVQLQTACQPQTSVSQTNFQEFGQNPNNPIIQQNLSSQSINAINNYPNQNIQSENIKS